jgi:hypothetical protein
MTVRIDAASAAIDVNVAGAKADVTAGKRIVAFHLTQGFDIADVEDAGNQPREALSATGRVRLARAPGESLSGWQFGFVQLAKMHAGAAFYAGRIASEGGIAVNFKNAMPSALLLDSIAGRSPFTAAPPTFDVVNEVVTCPMADHPALKVPQKLRNSARVVDNFLFHVLDDREFWTVLTAVDPRGVRQHLAHFHWRISHDVKFSWVKGAPIVGPRTSSFTLIGTARGAPPEPELQPLLADPAPPQFNDAAAAATLASFLGARGPNRSENRERFLNVPPTFFT